MPLISTAGATASLRAGRTALTALHSQVPLSLRATVDGLTVVASAFGPLGGDSTVLDLSVEDGARLAVGATGAQVAQPGPVDPVSHALVRVRAGAGSSLQWRPQPLVVRPGAEHRSRLEVTADAGARLLLSETVVQGGGRSRSGWHVTYAGVPLLAADTDLGPGAPDGWDGPAGTGGATVLLTALLSGSEGLPTGPFHGGELLQLAGPAVLLLWLGDDPVAANRCLDALGRVHAALLAV